MTLVLSVSTMDYGLQVGDRLVSKEGHPHDPLANKSVVLRAADGLVALSYTGPAFLRQQPTDVWLADLLADGACGNSGGGFISYGAFPIKDLGASLILIAKRLRRLRVFERHGGEVTAVGLQWNARRRSKLARPVLWHLHGRSGTFQWHQLQPRPVAAWRGRIQVNALGDWPFSDAGGRALTSAIGKAAGWTEVESLLVAAIRRASRERPGTIGPHCMSTVLRPFSHPNALVRFHPEEAHLGRAFDQDVDVAFSPWLLAPDAVLASSAVVGGMESEDGLLTYRVEAPEVPEHQRLKGAWQRQARPRA